LRFPLAAGLSPSLAVERTEFPPIAREHDDEFEERVRGPVRRRISFPLERGEGRRGGAA
jgi:hypothetical protein